MGFIFPSILSALINVPMKAISAGLEKNIFYSIYPIRKIFKCGISVWDIDWGGWQVYWPGRYSRLAVNPCGKKPLRSFWLRKFYYPFKMKYAGHFLSDKSRYFMLLSESDSEIYFNEFYESSWISKMLT